MMSIQLSTGSYLWQSSGRTLGIRDKSIPYALVVQVATTTEVDQFGHAPSSGPRSLLGDRPCVHENFKGSLVYQSSSDSVVSHDYGYGIVLPSIFIGGQWFFAATPGYQATFGDFTRVSGNVTYKYIQTRITVSGPIQNIVVENYGVTQMWMYGQLQLAYTTDGGRRFQMDTLTNKFVQQTCACASYTINKGVETYAGTVNVNFQTLAPNMSPLTLGLLKTKLSIVGGLLLADLPAAPENFNSGVALDAVEACRVVKINTLALGKDLSSLKTIASWASSLAKVNSLPKAARAYLGYQYGAPLTAKDVLSMAKSLSANARLRKWKGFSKARSRGSYTASSNVFQQCQWNCERTVKIVYTPIDNVGSNIVRSLYDYGMAPSMTNLWDFIPYSFVLGWAVNVNDYLAKIDAEEYLHTVNVRGVVTSDRYCITIPGSAIDAGLDGSLTYVYYHRAISSTVALENPSFSLSNPLNHLMEGGALILARHK